MPKKDALKLPSLKEIDAMAAFQSDDHECTGLCHDLLNALEELADLGQAAPDAREALDVGGRLGGRPGRVLAEVPLDRLAMVGQVAGRAVPVGPLEPLDAALLVLAEVGSQGVLADPGQPADVVVGQALALEVDGLHLQLHPWVGVVEPLEVKGLDILRAEVDGEHRRRPGRVSWVPAQAVSLRAT